MLRLKKGKKRSRAYAHSRCPTGSIPWRKMTNYTEQLPPNLTNMPNSPPVRDDSHLLRLVTKSSRSGRTKQVDLQEIHQTKSQSYSNQIMPLKFPSCAQQNISHLFLPFYFQCSIMLLTRSQSSLPVKYTLWGGVYTGGQEGCICTAHSTCSHWYEPTISSAVVSNQGTNGFITNNNSPSANPRLFHPTQIQHLIVLGSIDKTPQLQKFLWV